MRRKLVFFLFLFIWVAHSYSPELDYNQKWEINTKLDKEHVGNCITKLERENKKLRLELFKKDLAFRESTNNWRKWNRFGYMGKYQFGTQALEMTGYSHVTFKAFIRNPNVFPEVDQEKAMDSLMSFNRYVLRNYMKEYLGEKISKVRVTETGLLAAAHLSGPTNVKRFLDSNGKFDPKDSFGTKLSDYLKGFE